MAVLSEQVKIHLKEQGFEAQTSNRIWITYIRGCDIIDFTSVDCIDFVGRLRLIMIIDNVSTELYFDSLEEAGNYVLENVKGFAVFKEPAFYNVE